MQKARFHFAPISPAALIEEKDGEIYVWTLDLYGNPNNVSEDRITRIITLPVEASDFEKVDLRYQEIKDLVESVESSAQVWRMVTDLYYPDGATRFAPETSGTTLKYQDS